MALNPTWSLKGKAVKLGLTNPPTTDYGCQVNSVVLNQAHEFDQIPATACQDGLSSYRQSRPTVTINFLQDWLTVSGLSWFLWDHHGQNGFIAVQDPGTGAGWLSSCTFLRPDHSSPADTSAAPTTVTLPLVGTLQGIHPT
jgi:hypothetical protein